MSLEQHVRDALDEVDPRVSEQRVKSAIAGALGEFDPTASLELTSHFNHTFAPDMMMRWGRIERPVFLRFTDNLLDLKQDLSILDEHDPIVFGLATPSSELVDELELGDKSRDADLLLAAPEAVEKLTQNTNTNSTGRMLRNSLAHSGRGAIVDSAEASMLAQAFSRSFASAAEGNADETRSGLEIIDEYFTLDQSLRLSRVLQAVWEGGGSPLHEFPGTPELSANVGGVSLAYLLQLMDTDDLNFWRGVGRGVDLDDILSFITPEIARLQNFQSLINANLDTLRARACQVVDLGMLETSFDRRFEWGVEVTDASRPSALRLRGPGFSAAVAKSREELGPVATSRAEPLSVETFLGRAGGDDIVSLSIRDGDRHLELTDDNGAIDGNFIKAATSRLVSPAIEKIVVATSTGRVRVDFPNCTGVGVTKSDTLMADVLGATLEYLIHADEDVANEIQTFLGRTNAGVRNEGRGLPTRESGTPSLFDGLIVDGE